MRSVSLQGTSLTRGQRERLEQQKYIRSSFMNPVLAQSVEDTFKTLELRKEQGIKPEPVWFPHYKEIGTISIAEWMGY